MRDERGIVIGVVAIVGLTAIVSGPLVGVVDLTSAESGDGSVGVSGSVTVGDVTLPERAELASGRFGSETYYLHVPDARVELQRAIGQSILTYRLSIPELGFTREAVFFVSERDEGTFTLSTDETTVDPERVANDSYAGELTVNARNDAGSRILANETIAVEVT